MSWKSLFLPMESSKNAVFAGFAQRDVLCFHPHLSDSVQLIVMVLDQGEVLIYDMTDSAAGPKIVHKFGVTSQMTKNRANSIVTCASLISPQIVPHYNFRASASAAAVAASAGPGTIQHADSTGRTKEEAARLHLNNESITTLHNRNSTSMDSIIANYAHHPIGIADSLTRHFPRGVVGNSAGRVDVFTFDRYVMGFNAHDCEVVAVDTVVFPPDSYNSLSTTTNEQESLGFVTMGSDGSIFTWRRGAGSTSGAFHIGTIVHGGGIFRTHCLRAHTVPPTFPRELPTSMIVHGAPGYSGKMFVKSVDGICVEDTVELEGIFSTTTACAMDGSLFVIARQKVVFCVDYTSKLSKKVWTSTSTVVALELKKPIAVAACNNGGITAFLAEEGIVLGQYATYSNTRVRSLAFHYAAMLLCVVDQTGAVEMVEMPNTFLRHGIYSADRSLAQAHVIRNLVSAEEAGKLAAARARRMADEEACILARFMVPEDAKTYIGVQHRLL